MSNQTVLCECGCGDPAPIASYSHHTFGWIKGQPKRFIHGHHRRGFHHSPETRAKMSKPRRTRLPVEERRERDRVNGRKHYIAKARFVSQARRHGISPELYQEMYARQDGLCAICGQEETRTTKDGVLWLLAIDHDHDTGHIRGLLCACCNSSLGLVHDDIDLVRSMLDYLEEYE